MADSNDSYHSIVNPIKNIDESDRDLKGLLLSEISWRSPDTSGINNNNTFYNTPSYVKMAGKNTANSRRCCCYFAL